MSNFAAMLTVGIYDRIPDGRLELRLSLNHESRIDSMFDDWPQRWRKYTVSILRNFQVILL